MIVTLTPIPPKLQRQIARNLARGQREPLWLLRLRAWAWRIHMRGLAARCRRDVTVP